MNEPEETPKGVKISKLFKITVQCNNCDYWGKMEGGPLTEKPERAVFVCPECDTMNQTKWGLDI